MYTGPRLWGNSWVLPCMVAACKPRGYEASMHAQSCAQVCACGCMQHAGVLACNEVHAHACVTFMMKYMIAWARTVDTIANVQALSATRHGFWQLHQHTSAPLLSQPVTLTASKASSHSRCFAGAHADRSSMKSCNSSAVRA